MKATRTRMVVLAPVAGSCTADPCTSTPNQIVTARPSLPTISIRRRYEPVAMFEGMDVDVSTTPELLAVNCPSMVGAEKIVAVTVLPG